MTVTPINVPQPDRWWLCQNKNHYLDMLVWGECKTCHKEINPEVHEEGCDCYDCRMAGETEESDAYDERTAHLS